MPPIKKPQSSLKATRPSEGLVESPAPILTNTAPSIIRPMYDGLPNGRYLAEITDAIIVDVNGRPFLKIIITVTGDDVHGLSESFLLKPDFRFTSSSFHKLLTVTGTMPDRDQPLQTDLLIGQQLLLTVEEAVRNGKTYTNIVDVEDVPDDEADEETDDETEVDDASTQV
ncbi:hypothetical protein [Cohnella fermenti]|uniref:DUF669 domain-containing protein n=1 Tax=Cohnella fermenti TaxID=2565925 RepID=A0A4V3WDK9_9BACL|nr:hypothetical protein [Cohnella fermenti]THF72484.1 hypothetical protein E6C55_32980 [Cohnella fermenti]